MYITLYIIMIVIRIDKGAVLYRLHPVRQPDAHRERAGGDRPCRGAGALAPDLQEGQRAARANKLDME